MIDLRKRLVRRAAKGMTNLAGLAVLVAASTLAGGCSLLPFGVGGGTSKAQQALRPQIHEVAANPQVDCIAQDETPDADATAAELQLSDAAQPPSADGRRAVVANAPLTLDAPPCAACGCKDGAGAAAPATTPVDSAESAAAASRAMPAPAGPAGFVAATAGEDALQRLMDGNKRFVECEPENTYQWPQRPAGTAAAVAKRRPPAAMVLACSDWEVIPEAAFDARPGELFVVRVAGNVADEAVLHSARYAVDRYDIPLVVVLGHESCGAVGAGMRLDIDAAEGRPASHTIGTGEAEAHAAGDSTGDPTDSAIHANIDQAVARLRAADPALSRRIAAGRLRIVGAYYDQTNGQITLQPDASLSPPASEYVDLPQD